MVTWETYSEVQNGTWNIWKDTRRVLFFYCILQDGVFLQWFQLVFPFWVKTEAIGAFLVFVFKKENMLHVLLAVALDDYMLIFQSPVSFRRSCTLRPLAGSFCILSLHGLGQSPTPTDSIVFNCAFLAVCFGSFFLLRFQFASRCSGEN